MGEVFRAFDIERDSVVALKVLRRLSPFEVYRFKKEFRALANLSHPNLLALFELITEGAHWFYTMQLIEGVDFLTYVRGTAAPRSLEILPAADTTKDIPGLPFRTTGGGAERENIACLTRIDVRAHQPLEEEDQLRRLCGGLSQLILGVQALHAAGHVHRDIKPSNVLVDTNERVVLLDFGIIGSLEDSGRKNIETFGTPTYIAPEQIQDGAFSTASDMYSLGVMMYQALTGHAPFVGEIHQVLRDKCLVDPVVPADVAHVPRELSDLCVALLHRNAAKRPSCGEALQILTNWLISCSASASTVDEFDPPTQSSDDLLIGREYHLRVLHSALSDVTDGKLRVILMHGNSGMGKSTLCQHFLRTAQRGHNTLVLSGRCYERESVAYKAIDSLIDELVEWLINECTIDLDLLLPENIGDLTSIFPTLLRVERVAQTTPSRNHEPHALRKRGFAALRTLLSNIGRYKNLILHIDDLQWADIDSASLLSSLLQQATPPRMLLIASFRREDRNRHVVKRVLQSMKPSIESSGRSIELGVDGLSGQQARALASGLIRAQRDDRKNSPTSIERVARQIAHEADGNPLLVRQMVRHMTEIDTETLDGQPPNLHAVLSARIANLTINSRRLLDVVAVAGRPIRQEHALQAAELIRDGTSTMLSLQNGQFIRGHGVGNARTIEVYHDQIRATLLSSLEDEQRAACHRALVKVYQGQEHTDDEILAHHYAGAGDKERASAHYIRAGDAAREILAFSEAMQLYRRAIELCPPQGEDQHHVYRSLGDSAAGLGRGQDAAKYYLLASKDTPPLNRGDCRAKAAKQLLASGHVEEGLRVLDDELRESGTSLPRSRRFALVSLLWYRLTRRLRGLRWVAKAKSEVDLRLQVLHDSCAAAGVALGMFDTIRGAAIQARTLLLSLRLGEPSRVSCAFAMEAIYIGAGGAGADGAVRGLLGRASDIANKVDDPFARAFVCFCDGVATFLRGDFAEAASVLKEAENRLLKQPKGGSWELTTTRITMIGALHLAGSVGGLMACRREYARDAEERGDKYADNALRNASYSCWLVHDRPTRCREEIDKSVWVAPDSQVYNNLHFSNLEANAKLALYQRRAVGFLRENRHQFRALKRSLLPQIQVIRSLTNHMIGLMSIAEIAAGTVDRGHYDRLLRRSIRRLAAEKRGYATSWSLMLSAGRFAARGRTEQAVAALERALEVPGLSKLSEACIRYRLAAMVGGDNAAQLSSAAHTYMRREQIVRPDKFIECILPGFDRYS